MNSHCVMKLFIAFSGIQANKLGK